MPRFRFAIAQVAAFSIIAAQLLCGCAFTSVAHGLPTEAPSIDAHHQGTNGEIPPCHGEQASHSGSEQSSDQDVHDCAHCENSLSASNTADLVGSVSTSTKDLPEFSVSSDRPEQTASIDWRHREIGPPPDTVCAWSHTLVSQKILLLI